MPVSLTAATRQSLLAAKDTAELLSVTQNRLATGKKVNSALDNPNSFFTAAGLDARASDISNVLDSISNGVQVLQAANTGITSLTKLVDSAKAVANQALQTATGFSTKSTLSSTAITGATASNILGTTTADQTVTGASLGTATGTTLLSALSSPITATDTLTVNGKTISFVTGATPSAATVNSTSPGSGVSGNVVTDGLGNSKIYLTAGTLTDLGLAIDIATGNKTVTNSAGTATPSAAATTAAAVTSNALVIHTTATQDFVTSGTAVTKFGFSAGTTQVNTNAGLTLTVGATAGGTATSITLGTGTNQISTLSALNTALAANNLQASIDTTGVLSITTTNDAASSTIGTVGGTFAAGGKAFAAYSGLGGSAPVADANSQLTRTNLINQYNGILDQITTTAQDSSYNGVNLLSGDTLKLVFNETGKSTLSITGVNFGFSGLGLAKLGQGSNATSTTNEFRDNASINSVINSLTTASTNLRTQASGFGTNLTVVQGRQNFNKSLINVLQTGSSNLTSADLNEEAANSQALTTRQSLTISSLSLANQSQQSILQLLR